ncbi:MAG TPA: carboxy-S-adenosyl-L-methionine synthase CmoA [Methylotenera sp.]|nr:carboxy-S-adenosyl-L-methionine synthase CmoA [Methylotenera sp.]
MADERDTDKLYSQPLNRVEDFKFDDKVAAVFDNMIHRSVPGYDAIIAMIGIMAEKYLVPGSYCYDLGCSLGVATSAICARMPHNDYQVIAVDNSQAMIDAMHSRIQSHNSRDRIELKCEDVRNIGVSNASFVVMNFVLQFIPQDERQAVLDNISHGMLPGGVFILSEKISFDDAAEQRFQIDMHHEFKKLNGYSELEISQKRAALEKILIPDNIAEHQARLRDAGFSRSYSWFQCFNFISIVAFK